MLPLRFSLASIIAGVVLADGTPIVNLTYIQVEGSTVYQQNFSTNVYYGIRYAQPITPSLRWTNSSNIETNSPYPYGSLVNATTPAPECVQGTAAWGYAPYKSNITLADAKEPNGQEDCLTLDVYVPTNPVSNSLPVLVMIHGGGYIIGNSSERANSGEGLTYASNGSIIFVSVQYRLGAFGFLGSSEVIANGTANAGLLDQRNALGWVQRHIAAFGGDPTKVTITGQSAGGGSVMNQMLLNGAPPNPPFRGVIAEFPYVQSYKSAAILEAQYQQLLAQTNCTTIQCLRTVDTNTLKLAAQKSFILGYIGSSGPLYGYGDYYYGPAVDGKTITDYPSRLFGAGKFTKVPLLVDHDTDEGFIFTNGTISTEAAVLTDLQELIPGGTTAFFNKIFQLYNVSDYPNSSDKSINTFPAPFWQLAGFYGDYAIDCATYFVAAATAKAGLATYKLDFGIGYGLHGDTINYIYGVPPFPQGWNASDANLARIMKNYWLSFVIDQNPNTLVFSGGHGPRWLNYSTTINGNNYPALGVFPNYQIFDAADPDAGEKCQYLITQSNITQS